MSYIGKLNKKLNKLFNGQVAAREDSGCLMLSGEMQRWSDIVYAGRLAVENNPYHGFVNEIACTGEQVIPVRKPRIQDSAVEWEEPDVLIIGGGIIGCATARELSKYHLKILLVEKEHDLAMQASGRNSGTVHSGFDLKAGTLRYKYCKTGNPMFEKISSELGVEFKRTTHILCCANKIWEPFMFISLLYRKWRGIKGIKMIKGDKLRNLEPAVNPNISSALEIPGSGIIDPIALTIAYAENAVQNGVIISLETMVQGMTVEEGMIKNVVTNRGTIHPKVVINAAGIFCEDIAAIAGDRFYSIHPRKGTNIILDKKYANRSVNAVISMIGGPAKKKKHTKGGAVRQTITGSTLVGPDAFETIHKEDFSTASQNIKEIIKTHKRAIPSINEDDMISYYSGIRAASYEEDFIISKGRSTKNIIHAAGIQSPGLTAAPAISEDIAGMVIELFGGEETIGINTEFDPIRNAPPRPATMDTEARSALIESNPDYGIIVCRCEEISKGEIINALRRNIKCETIDSVKRRVRTGTGRCQGGFCGPQILDIIAAEKRIPLHAVKKGAGKSELLFGNVKTAMQKRTPVSDDSELTVQYSSQIEEQLHERANEISADDTNDRKDAVDDE